MTAGPGSSRHNTLAAGETLRVRVPEHPATEYEVRIVAGSLNGLGTLCREAVRAHRFAIVSDSRVGELYGEAALASFGAADRDADLFTFPAGEWNKNREEWAALSDRLLRAGLGRDAAIVALGGGVTGDLAGFAAATYMRGIPVIQVPTTLLSMVDSSVGGKTGVDTEVGKNLIGAFHHPKLVVVDTELLATLPLPQLASGLAEVVKMGAILDVELFEWLEERTDALLERDAAALEFAVRRCVELKAHVVESDPRECNGRSVLNFGHTVGHALELLGGYEVLHGEAVAAGMRVEARLGEALGVTEPHTSSRLEALLETCRLDRKFEEERRASSVYEAMMRDKKMRDGTVRCVLLRRIGEAARSPGGNSTFELPPDTAERLEVALRPAEEG